MNIINQILKKITTQSLGNIIATIVGLFLAYQANQLLKVQSELANLQTLEFNYKTSPYLTLKMNSKEKAQKEGYWVELKNEGGGDALDISISQTPVVYASCNNKKGNVDQWRWKWHSLILPTYYIATPYDYSRFDFLHTKETHQIVHPDSLFDNKAFLYYKKHFEEKKYNNFVVNFETVSVFLKIKYHDIKKIEHKEYFELIYNAREMRFVARKIRDKELINNINRVSKIDPLTSVDDWLQKYSCPKDKY